MGLGSEVFATLAILEARDQASAIYDKVQAKVAQFSEAMKAAATSADASGAKIDESFLKTASGADALTVATAKVEAAQAKLDASTKAQADAEKALLDAQEQVRVAADGDAAAMDKQVAAADRLTAAQKETAKQTKALRDAQADQKAITEAQAPAVDGAAKKAENAGSKFDSVASTMGKVGLGIAVAGGLMARSAANFQSSTSVLATSGGETAGELDKARQGILNLSGSTGTATKELTSGLYMLGSAGFDVAHGGLQALQASAQGAKAENADLGTVSNALSTILTDYGIKVQNNAKGQQAANAVMDQMIAVVQNGKTTTEALAGSLSAVLPVASSAKLGFDQIGGALATMTGQGMSAQQASQDLAHTIGSLQNPNAVAIKEMQAMGLNANDVSKNLGTKGLTGTIAELTGAITAHMGPAGLVVQNAFQNSTAAAQNANAMIEKMPPNLQKLAKAYLDGSVNSKDFKKDLQSMDPINAHLMQQFGATADKTHAFNDLLASGSPAAQTYNAALSKMMGGSTGLTTALMLSGKNMDKFKENVGKVSDAAKNAGSSVDGWKQIQGNFNQKLAEAKQTVEATTISVGTALLPAVTSLVQGIMAIIQPIASWVEHNQKLTVIILGAAAGLGILVGAINLGVKAYKAVKSVIDAVSTVVSKVAGLFGGAKDAQDAAAVSADGAAASADGLAASEDGAAASTEASTVAQDANSGSLIRSGLAAAGAAAKFVIVKTAQMAVTLATKAWTAAQWLFNAAMNASPIMLVVTALAALAGGIIYAYTHFQAFRDVVKKVWDWIKTAVVDTINFVKDHWELIVQIFTGPIGIVATKIYDHWSTIKRYFMDGVHAVEHILSWFGSLPGKFGRWLSSTASSIAHGIASAVSWFAGLPGRVTSAIAGFFGGLGSRVGAWIYNGLVLPVFNVGAQALDWFDKLPGRILDAVSNFGSLLFQAGKNLIQGLIDGIKNMAGSAVDAVKGVGSSMVHGLGSLGSGVGHMLGFAEGGAVPGAAGQAMLAVVHGGEYVLSRDMLAGRVNPGVPMMTKLTGTSASLMQLPSMPARTGGTGGDVHIHNHFEGAHVSSERDMELLANKVSAAVARILPTGGLRVAM